MVWLPVKMAVSAIVIEDEKFTGVLGTERPLGRTDWRFEAILTAGDDCGFATV